ncbi:MAG TPA: hypothetical protein VFV74_03980 [Burkholderiales bacterium]|nr:hypothetical protein [Burkholderiales bacterium]
MRFSRDELKRLLPALGLALAVTAGGSVLVWLAGNSVAGAERELAAARNARQQNLERLARIAEEEREVREKLDVYQRLRQLHILGEEDRLEWADTIARIRRERELLDLRYVVDRQKLLVSVPGKPASIDFYSSTMKVSLALLHEEDLLRFLSDLRASGNAYYSVRRCDVARAGQTPAGAAMAPRLSAQCEIDLITIQDRGAKR